MSNRTFKSRGSLARKRVSAKLKSMKGIRRAPVRAAVRAAVAAVHESGFLDTNLSGLVSTLPVITLLNTLPQGASVNQRVGKKVYMKGLQLRGAVANDAAAGINQNTYLIVYDKRPTGSMPTITDILVSSSPTSMNNDQNAGRFRIIRRHDYVLNGPPGGPTGNTSISLSEYIKLKNLPTVYKAAGTGGIGDIEQGALYYVTVGTGAAPSITGSGSTTSLQARLRYTDM